MILFGRLAVGGGDAGNDTVRGSLFSYVDLERRIGALSGAFDECIDACWTISLLRVF